MSEYRSMSLEEWVKEQLPVDYEACWTVGRDPSHPSSMTTVCELDMLRSYGRHVYTGWGRVVDLGIWLGATTRALCEGLRDREFKPGAFKPVIGIDRFVWEDWMTPIAQGLGVERTFAEGEDFRELVATQFEKDADLVEILGVDLSLPVELDFAPIECLFVDAMKSWDLASQIVAGFFGQLRPGSLLVQQDFAWHDAVIATNVLIMWRYREFFELLAHVPYSCSVLFRCCEKPELKWPVTASSFDAEDFYAAYSWVLPQLPEVIRASILTNGFLQLASRGLGSSARMLWDACEQVCPIPFSSSFKETFRLVIPNHFCDQDLAAYLIERTRSSHAAA